MSSATHWFGNLQLAYKYIVVFLGLLVLTMIAGAIKVLFDRRKLKKARQAELEAGPKDDTVELNQREKDEGDLFGIRAIEAGFFAGVAQSRPTSRATSRAGSFIELPSGSSSTLVGNNANSPMLKAHSANTSVLSLNLGQDNSQRRTPSPSTKLRPSEAELNGRRNHNGSAVDVSLQVPPSPGLRGSASPTFGGSESDHDDYARRPNDFNSQQYAPAPTIPMPDALRVSYHSGNDNFAKSQSASFNNSPSQSPTPPRPGNPPAARLPTLPTNAMRKDSRSPSPDYDHPRVRVHQPNNEPSQPSSAPQVQSQTHAPGHSRDESDASSNYSHGNRLSTFQAYQAYQKHADRSTSAASNDSYSYNHSSTDGSGRTSMVLGAEKEGEPQIRQVSAYLAPGPAGNDSRLSDFYDAYYRNSHLGPSQPAEAKRPVDRHSTIMEVDSPMPSPRLPKTHEPGAAF